VVAGPADDECARRLVVQALVFLTQDTEFAELPSSTAATVMISRVPQAIPIARRVELWLQALDDVLQFPTHEKLFEALSDGRVEAWKSHDL